MSNTEFEIIIGLLVGLSIITERLSKKSRKRKKVTKKVNATKQQKQLNIRASNIMRSDDIILSSKFEDMSGFEFERLLALYFRDQGYTVIETGKDAQQGNSGDGGVDLVIINGKGEHIAVQAKNWANNVDVKVVRELNSAKRNHNCILTLLITTSDLTIPAKEEAEKLKVDFWHGAFLKHKLQTWGKWKPAKKSSWKQNKGYRDASLAKEQIAASSDNQPVCTCGSTMVKRRNKKDGSYFWGCSRFPECRQTRSI